MRDLKISQRDLLLIVDIQNDFCRGGALEVPGGDDIVPVINRLAGRFPHVGLTQDWHPKGHISFASSHEGKNPFDSIELRYGDQILWPDHCVPGTVGAQFHPGLDTVRGEFIVRKGYRLDIDSYSSFFENDRETRTGLAGYLRDRDIERLFLAGLATDFCVFYSALDGRKEGFEVFVIEDAVCGIDVDGSVIKAWEAMENAGVTKLISSDLTF